MPAREASCTPPGVVALPLATTQSVHCYSHGSHETNEFDVRWMTYFNKPDIDAYKLSKGMKMLIGYDLVPEPSIIDAALQSCRHLIILLVQFAS